MYSTPAAGLALGRGQESRTQARLLPQPFSRLCRLAFQSWGPLSHNLDSLVPLSIWGLCPRQLQAAHLAGTQALPLTTGSGIEAREVPRSASSHDYEAAGLTGQGVRAGVRVLRVVFRLCPMSLFETQQGTPCEEWEGQRVKTAVSWSIEADQLCALGQSWAPIPHICKTGIICLTRSSRILKCACQQKGLQPLGSGAGFYPARKRDPRVLQVPCLLLGWVRSTCTIAARPYERPRHWSPLHSGTLGFELTTEASPTLYLHQYPGS